MNPRYIVYRAWMKFLHRHDWHHAPVRGPMEPASPDGKDWIRRCDWCGFTQGFSDHGIGRLAPTDQEGTKP